MAPEESRSALVDRFLEGPLRGDDDRRWPNLGFDPVGGMCEDDGAIGYAQLSSTPLVL